MPARWAAILVLIALLASMVAGQMLIVGEARAVPDWLILAVLTLAIAVALVVTGRRMAFGGALIAVMLTIGGWQTIKTSLHKDGRVRSYFGIYTIADTTGPARFLQHGTTLHGEQSLVPGRERDPLTYYAPKSGVGLAMTAVPKLFAHPARVGIVGLGAGTLACYAQPRQDWRFYEIDPAIAAIARDPNKFTFLSRCLPGVPIEIGDARVNIAADPAHALDVLVIDAFSSDAVPMHLLTREALATYARRLDTGGLLMIHISNRFMTLEPILAAAEHDGWHTMARTYIVSPEDVKRAYSSSLWIALAREQTTLDRLKALSGPENWRPTVPRPGFPGWSDDYASILPLLKWGETQ